METNVKIRKRKNSHLVIMDDPSKDFPARGLELTAPNALTPGAIALRIARLDHEALAGPRPVDIAGCAPQPAPHRKSTW